MSNQIKINYTRNDNGVAEPSKHKGAQQAEPNREKTNTSNTNTGVHDGNGTQGEKAIVRCSNGDPINMATGAFYYEDSDFILSESSYDFHLIRRYISVKERGSRKSIGWKWTLSVDTCVCRDGETTIVILPDSKEVEFKYDNGVYKNKRGNNKRYTLIRPEEKFIFEDNENNHTYIYDKEGKIETVTDRYGNKTKYEYSDYGIEKVILSTGLTLTFTWKDMKVSTIEDNTGRKVEYHYDRGILSEVIRCDGTTLKYTYDENQNLTTITDGNGSTYVTNEYDEKGRVKAQHISDGGFTTYAYDEKNKTNTYKDEINHISIQYTYDERLDIVRVAYEDGTEEKTEMTEDGLIGKEIDRNKATTRYTYDECGHIIKKEEPSGLITTYTYKGKDIEKIEDNEGRSEEYTYTEKGNIKKKKIKLGVDKSGKARYHEYSYSYDEQGRKTKLEENSILKEEYIYKANHNRPTEIRKASGEAIRLKYDESLRLIEIETSAGIEKYEYTPYNKIKSHTNEEGGKITYYYDKSWRLIKKVGIENNKLGTIEDKGESYSYDDMDRLIGKEDETGVKTTYKLNTNGDIIEEIQGDKTTVKYDYDKDFNIIRKHTYIDSEKVATEKYAYNPCGQMIKKIPSDSYNKETDDGAAYIYTRDQAGRIKEVYNPYGQMTDTYDYDKRGNVVCHKHSYVKGNVEINTYLKETERAGDIYTYDATGKQIEKRQLIEVDEEGNLLYAINRYIYDDNERLIKDIAYLEKNKDQEEPAGPRRIVERKYDDADRLIKVSDTTGASITYEYDNVGKIIKEIRKADEKGDDIIEYSYDKRGKVIVERKIEVREQEQTKETTKPEITSTDQPATAKRRNRFLSIAEVEERTKQPERIEKIIAETKISYDKAGRITEIIRPEGRIERQEYDEAGRKKKIQAIDKEQSKKYEISYKYDQYGYLSEKNENGIITSYVNNALGNCVEKINPDGGRWTYKYDAEGNIVNEVSPIENADIQKTCDSKDKAQTGTKYIYDYCGNLIKKVSPYGTVIEEIKYDLYGNITEKVQADGESIRYTYDLAGRRIQAETKEGIREKYTYDACGNMTSNTTGSKVTTYETDHWGRVTTVNAPEGVKEHYAYDHRGNITKATDGAGNIREYRINSFGKADKITYADGESEYIKYDGEGNAIKHTKRSGKEVSYSYDYLGNILKTEGEKDKCEYIYDETGRIIKAKSQGITYNYTYDNSGRLQEKKACGRSLISYTYNLNGNIETIKDVTGKETKYTYDLENNLIAVEDNGTKVTEYKYTKGGKISKIKCGDIETSYTYDKAGNRTSITTTVGEELLGKTEYSYDNKGNCVSKNTVGASTRYTYDGLNRLVEEERTQGTEGISYKYTYDAAGNRTSLNKTHYTTNETLNSREIKAEETQVYTYNSLNQLQTLDEKISVKSELTSQSKVTNFTYDKNGNLTSDGRGMYTYDDFDQMTSAKMENGNLFTGRYDAEGLRHETEENGHLIKYIYRNRDVAVEENEEDGTTRYIRGNGRLIASDSEKARTYYHYVSDNIGSITYILNNTSNNVSGQSSIISDRIECSYEYDAFGNVIECKEKIRNIFKFAGEQYDPLTNQYYLKARYYNPVIGRFTQMDTYHGDGLNLYAYVGNNPIRYVDPSGHDKIIASCKDGSVSEGGSKVDFYVTPNGDVVPATGYRYMDSKYAEQTMESMSAPGSYFGFEKYDSASAAQDAFQIAPEWSNCKLRGEFDTLQVIDGMYVPKAYGDKGPGLEPFTRCYPEYGKGGCQQFIYKGQIYFKNVDIIND